MAPGDKVEEIILPQLERFGYASVREMIQDMHVEKQIGFIDIGLKFGISSTSVATLAKKHGVNSNPRGSGGKKRWSKDMGKHFI